MRTELICIACKGPARILELGEGERIECTDCGAAEWLYKGHQSRNAKCKGFKELERILEKEDEDRGGSKNAGQGEDKLAITDVSPPTREGFCEGSPPGPLTLELNADLLQTAAQEEKNEALADFFLLGTEAIRQGCEVNISDPGKMVIEPVHNEAVGAENMSADEPLASKRQRTKKKVAARRRNPTTIETHAPASDPHTAPNHAEEQAEALPPLLKKARRTGMNHHKLCDVCKQHQAVITEKGERLCKACFRGKYGMTVAEYRKKRKPEAIPKVKDEKAVQALNPLFLRRSFAMVEWVDDELRKGNGKMDIPEKTQLFEIIYGAMERQARG